MGYKTIPDFQTSSCGIVLSPTTSGYWSTIPCCHGIIIVKDTGNFVAHSELPYLFNERLCDIHEIFCFTNSLFDYQGPSQVPVGQIIFVIWYWIQSSLSTHQTRKITDDYITLVYEYHVGVCLIYIYIYIYLYIYIWTNQCGNVIFVNGWLPKICQLVNGPQLGWK